MSRIALIDSAQAPLLARPYYGADGSASPIVGALAQVPELLEAAMPLISRALGEGAVDLRTKETVILRVSARAGCRYCTDTHTVAAWDAGLSMQETAELVGGGIDGDGRRRALVEWCDAFAAAPEPIPDDVASALREHFGDSEIVELAVVAGVTLMLNRFCTSLGLPTPPATRARLEAVLT
jgi:AhpD family alkylhydroperoxidase